MVECRRPEVQELTAQKAVVCALFEDVLKTNFPYAETVSEKAEESYSSLIRYAEDGSAIIYCVFQENVIVGLLWAYRRSFMGDPASETFTDSTCLPPQRSGYIELVCTVPTGWQELSVTYTPTFASGKSLTFTMSASDVAKG